MQPCTMETAQRITDSWPSARSKGYAIVPAAHVGGLLVGRSDQFRTHSILIRIDEQRSVRSMFTTSLPD